MTHAEGKIHNGHENVRRHHDQHHPSHRRRKAIVKPGDGIDVSENNGSVDWKKADTKKPWLAMAKATEGATYVDKLWTPQRVTEMEATHARAAMYPFCRPDNNPDPKAEVHNLIRAAEKAGAEFVGAGWYSGKAKVNGWRVFVDFETPPFSAKWLAGWGEEFHRITGHLADLYGYGSSLNPVAAVLDHFHAIDFAAYVTDWKPYAVAEVEAKVRFWQHSANGSWPGVSGAVDLDRFLG
jgi:lysozyme